MSISRPCHFCQCSCHSTTQRESIPLSIMWFWHASWTVRIVWSLSWLSQTKIISTLWTFHSLSGHQRRWQQIFEQSISSVSSVDPCWALVNIPTSTLCSSSPKDNYFWSVYWDNIDICSACNDSYITLNSLTWMIQQFKPPPPPGPLSQRLMKSGNDCQLFFIQSNLINIIVFVHMQCFI